MKILLVALTLLSLACQLSAVTSAPEAKAVMQSAPLTEPTATANTGTISAASAVNVRNQPNEHGDWLGYKYTGDTVTVIECVGNWARIGAGQYVNGRYIDGGICR